MQLVTAGNFHWTTQQFLHGMADGFAAIAAVAHYIFRGRRGGPMSEMLLARSITLSEVIWIECGSSCVSTAICRLMPETCVPA
ncbi:MAG: hypothetical protein JO189_04520 [Deltaproteobacteria bacterium]|nr:hypothetical protein [Deltaproteobacteria bacterium]